MNRRDVGSPWAVGCSGEGYRDRETHECMYGGEERRDEKCLPRIEAGEPHPTAIASKAMIAHRRGCDSRRHSWSDLVIHGSQRETNNKSEARGGRRHDGDESSGGLRGKDVFHSRVSQITLTSWHDATTPL